MAASPSRQAQGIGKLLSAGFLLLLWVATVALASSPHLHLLVHSDAQSPTHHCLVTQLQQHSGIESFQSLVVPVASTAFIAPVFLAPISPAPIVHYRLLPGRAPPSVFSSSPVVG